MASLLQILTITLVVGACHCNVINTGWREGGHLTSTGFAAVTELKSRNRSLEAGSGSSEVEAGSGSFETGGRPGSYYEKEAGSGSPEVEARQGSYEAEAGSGSYEVEAGSGSYEVEAGSGSYEVEGGSGSSDVVSENQLSYLLQIARSVIERWQGTTNFPAKNVETTTGTLRYDVVHIDADGGIMESMMQAVNTTTTETSEIQSRNSTAAGQTKRINVTDTVRRGWCFLQNNGVQTSCICDKVAIPCKSGVKKCDAVGGCLY